VRSKNPLRTPSYQPNGPTGRPSAPFLTSPPPQGDPEGEVRNGADGKSKTKSTTKIKIKINGKVKVKVKVKVNRHRASGPSGGTTEGTNPHSPWFPLRSPRTPS